MNSSKPAILLTGFTGILGKRYAYRLAELGYTVICPVRASSEREAQDRMQSVFHKLGEFTPDFKPELEKQIRAVPGDVRKKWLGIPDSIRDEFRAGGIEGVWHLAARLDLTDTCSQDVYDTNLVGTLNVLEFIREYRIPQMHYFSTFGSSGEIREGIVREIPGIRPPSFRNTYERSKWEAERHVWQAQIRGEVEATIYRPSIVVGDSLHGRYEQFNAFNHVFDVIDRVRIKLCEKRGLDPRTDSLKYDLRVLGDRNATLNIVPIDFVLDTVMKIFSMKRSSGRVYHIVNPNPPSLALAEKTFKQNVPWEDIHWDLFDPKDGFRDPYEKFIAKQLEFLTPYLLGEAVYDHSNVHAILALHGGIPEVKNEVFLDAIMRRGREHGWQEEPTTIKVSEKEATREQLKSNFVWPENETVVVDFQPYHPADSVQAQLPSPAQDYPVADRLIGKAYRVREKILSKFSTRKKASLKSQRDIVLVPFGLGVTRRGEAEVHCYQYNPQIAHEVFARMSQVAGFDLRAFARNEIPRHEVLGDLHDNGCWSVTDDLIHIIRLFRDFQRHGATGVVNRLQILPFSAGTHLAGWLSGIVSFDDMALLVHQCMHLMSENEDMVTGQEIVKWFYNPREKLSEVEKNLLKELRGKVDPESRFSAAELARVFHGKLELVFALNAGLLEGLNNDIRENRIGVSPAIKMSPNVTVFAGNELEMARFRQMFVGKRKIELRRVPVDVKGTPHFPRLKEAARHSTELLKLYDRQGRLRDPAVPMMSYNGEAVRTKEQYIKAMAGIADQPCYFDRMVERTLEEGGRHYLLIQSGLSSTAGDLFGGVIQSNANVKRYDSVKIYPPALKTQDLHPVCQLLPQDKSRSVSDALEQPLAQTISWYEKELLKAFQEQESAGSSTGSSIRSAPQVA
jgi:nucleoside-diphosphate-sugar epimerase